MSTRNLAEKQERGKGDMSGREHTSQNSVSGMSERQLPESESAAALLPATAGAAASASGPGAGSVGGQPSLMSQVPSASLRVQNLGGPYLQQCGQGHSLLQASGQVPGCFLVTTLCTQGAQAQAGPNSCTKSGRCGGCRSCGGGARQRRSTAAVRAHRASGPSAPVEVHHSLSLAVPTCMPKPP